MNINNTLPNYISCKKIRNSLEYIITFALPKMTIREEIVVGIRGRGEIGRRARLRIWCRKAWGFESLRPYDQTREKPSGLAVLRALFLM
jgi:hypothetical protein